MRSPSILQGETRTRLLQGMAIGAIAPVVIGFSWGGWTTGGTANRLAGERANTVVVTALTAPGARQWLSLHSNQERYDAGSILNGSSSFFKEASMPATASLAKFILGGIAASLVATFPFAAAPSSSAQTDAAPTDGSHTHKGDRLALVHAVGPGLTVSAPSVGQLGISSAEIDGLNVSEHVLDRSDAAANTTLALKNVTVVGQAIDVLKTPKPHNGADRDPQDPSQKLTPAGPVSCDVGTKPAADPILRRLDGRCFA